MPSVDLRLGDCLEVMRGMAENSVDSVITDPPYMIDFMGKAFDKSKDNIAASVDLWAECLRVAKPGAILLAFGGTRTYHRLTCAIEDAGWEIRDCLMWVYGSGFPKSHNISKAIDKAAGAEREQLGLSPNRRPGHETGKSWKQTSPHSMDYQLTAPATDAAKLWDGWGTALKPAFEPIILAQAPLSGTYAQNALQHGVAGLWIDGCRIETNDDRSRPPGRNSANTWDLSYRNKPSESHPQGRWPSNLLLDECAAEMLDRQSGVSTRPGATVRNNTKNPYGSERTWSTSSTPAKQTVGYADTGGASRFFYVAKASRRDRSSDGTVENTHPTCKPVQLMRYLCRLTRTPTGGTVLDPFMGSGTTGCAAVLEGRDFIGIEISEEYMAIAEKRIEHAQRQVTLPLLEAAD